jgi:hypothetical protein
MLNKIKEMIRVLPAHMAAVVRHACLTGLRPAEAVESVSLLLASGIPDGNYYNPERQTLEHFRFPDVFLGTTKKEFISYITLDNLQPITKMESKTRVQRNKADMQAPSHRHGHDMSLCRKIFASWLRKEGIQLKLSTYYKAEYHNRY